jgi:glycosyltransferase involved in cell wall biosynthesis
MLMSSFPGRKVGAGKSSQRRARQPALVPLISVIIPHFNQPDHLRRCLESLQDQTFNMADVEIIVVDNGSKVVPAEICQAFAGVRLDQEMTPGPGPARNKGVSQSRGQILAFIDADCIADPGWLEAIATELRTAENPGIIGGDVRIALSNPTNPTALDAYESIFAYRQKEYIERHRFSGTLNLAMRRSIYDGVGPFAGIEVAEDRVWGQRATKLGYLIHYVPGMVVFHPARKSFDELSAAWDRHISHDFAERAQKPALRLRWVLRALAVAASPVFEARRIVTSARVSTWRERRLTALVLIRIRLYRAARMVKLLLKGVPVRTTWNQEMTLRGVPPERALEPCREVQVKRRA